MYYGIDYGLVPISANEWKYILEQTKTYFGGLGRLATLTPDKWERLFKRLGVSFNEYKFEVNLNT